MDHLSIPFFFFWRKRKQRQIIFFFSKKERINEIPKDSNTQDNFPIEEGA